MRLRFPVCNFEGILIMKSRIFCSLALALCCLAGTAGGNAWAAPVSSSASSSSSAKPPEDTPSCNAKYKVVKGVNKLYCEGTCDGCSIVNNKQGAKSCACKKDFRCAPTYTLNDKTGGYDVADSCSQGDKCPYTCKVGGPQKKCGCYQSTTACAPQSSPSSVAAVSSSQSSVSSQCSSTDVEFTG